MEWVLIIMMGYNIGGVATEVFYNKESCENAAEQVMLSTKEQNRTAVVCVPYKIEATK